jgi:hypothetical protein
MSLHSYVNEPQRYAGGEPFSRRYQTPRDVLNCPSLNGRDKRIVLSAWASDVWAPTSLPGLRLPPGLLKPVSIDEILEALRSLDEPTPPAPGGASQPIPGRATGHLRKSQVGRYTRRFLERHFFPLPKGQEKSSFRRKQLNEIAQAGS